jgi:hypothetical protein
MRPKVGKSISQGHKIEAFRERCPGAPWAPKPNGHTTTRYVDTPIVASNSKRKFQTLAEELKRMLERIML